MELLVVSAVVDDLEHQVDVLERLLVLVRDEGIQVLEKPVDSTEDLKARTALLRLGQLAEDLDGEAE